VLAGGAAEHRHHEHVWNKGRELLHGGAVLTIDEA